MNPDLILWVGGGAVFGAVVMALALLVRRRPVETPTAAYDVIDEYFDEAIKDLLPMFIADFPGIPLGDTEEGVIRDIERGLASEDPDFIRLFHRGDTH
ncbi:hypothetical protein [Glycomyces paridis]|uniref:Uncharacterized protein n=1 Tax=Glycomyces paridis TaxID=2126555 RepID=A0A4S8P8G9_9ACTN|nr:hypothetical protein [Glycomyces paridis]THV25971.1 hypothetical protein E9998_19755 [Glycomyces paridis]